jgi:putative membrane protein
MGSTVSPAPRLLPRLLLGAYILLFLLCAIRPHDRAVWFAENAPILLLVAGVVWIWRHHHFSNTACLLMFVLPALHTIGGHFTFERVPFGFVSDLFGFERNHYDRLAHFSVGFYAYAVAEYLLASGAARRRWVVLAFPVCAILALAALYEIFEWGYALSADPAAGIAVLGSQGDVWDAQKDMLADGLGALAAILLFAWAWRRELSALKPSRPHIPA